MYLFICLSTLCVSCGKFGWRYLGKATAAARAALPIPNSACGSFVCPYKGTAAKQRCGIFNVRTDVNACDCTWRLYGYRTRVCTESSLWEKNHLPHRGIESALAACRSGALPTELHPRPAGASGRNTFSWSQVKVRLAVIPHVTQYVKRFWKKCRWMNQVCRTQRGRIPAIRRSM